MKSYSKFKRQALKDKELLKEYNKLAPEFAIAKAIIGKRISSGLTQKELAQKIGTKQSAISRLESGSYNPSVTFLEKVAKALNLHLVINMN